MLSGYITATTMFVVGPAFSSRTIIAIRKPTTVGEEVFIRGGGVRIKHPCNASYNSAYDQWKNGDSVLDWNGAEESQGTWQVLGCF